jgi:hypothetical protein
MCHRVTGQSRNSALYQDRHQYEYNLCYKNHVRFHYYRILWFTFTWNKILSDIRKNFTCQGSFKTALWFYNTYIPFLDSNTTLTFNTWTSCQLVWSAERWGNTCFLPQSRVNEFVYDVHTGRTGKFLDHFQQWRTPPEIPKISVESSIAWARWTGVSISFCSSLCSHTVVIY